ncbi:MULTISPECIES: glutaminyl-peptide cyclotransferase [Oceanisphaera]|uniref:Glutaminyl-peptide cyclotransferase n=1 Tax=Oceanisphaera ostreae TaxID=914151 RepID=A0ABW3KKF4_9GAMM
MAIWLYCLSTFAVTAADIPSAANHAPVVQLTVKVIERLPHDHTAFTQGLEWHQGVLYESTGLYGNSSLRKVDPRTGEVLAKRELDAAYFGEGLTRVGQQLIQLTWREGLALVYDLSDLSLKQAFQYGGEGWGLCFDGESLWMSNGSSRLYKRNPNNFAVQAQLNVTLNGQPVLKLNDLACVNGHIYANIWKESRLVRINKNNGRIEAEIDASALVAESGQSDPEAVLNGITYDEQAEVFYLTGKHWPNMFKVTW